MAPMRSCSWCTSAARYLILVATAAYNVPRLRTPSGSGKAASCSDQPLPGTVYTFRPDLWQRQVPAVEQDSPSTAPWVDDWTAAGGVAMVLARAAQGSSLTDTAIGSRRACKSKYRSSAQTRFQWYMAMAGRGRCQP